jgi:hypothetical protein
MSAVAEVTVTKVARSVTVNPSKTTLKHPDPLKHQIVSFAKSALRIIAGCFLFASLLKSAAVLLILAELLGILEELV